MLAAHILLSVTDSTPSWRNFRGSRQDRYCLASRILLERVGFEDRGHFVSRTDENTNGLSKMVPEPLLQRHFYLHGGHLRLKDYVATGDIGLHVCEPRLKAHRLEVRHRQFSGPAYVHSTQRATYTWSCIRCRPRDPFICSLHLAKSHQSEAKPNAVNHPFGQVP